MSHWSTRQNRELDFHNTQEVEDEISDTIAWFYCEKKGDPPQRACVKQVMEIFFAYKDWMSEQKSQGNPK